MTDKFIADLLRMGKLRKQQAGIVQIEALLNESLLDLTEAKKTLSIAERATYILAYMAMLKAGRALLLYNGFTPDDGAQHKTVVEVTGHFLGIDYKAITGHFERMRRKRNDMTYEAGALLSVSEARKAFEDAIQLVRGVLEAVKKNNPQLELKIDLNNFK